MNKRKICKVIVIIVICCLIGSIISINIGNAAPIDDLEGEKLKRFNLGSDIAFRGVFSSHSWVLNIDKWWKLDKVEGNIVYNVTQLIDDKKEATLTVSINGIPFYSKRIVYKAEDQNIMFEIPKNLIREGGNQLKIEGYCRVSDKPCNDDNNYGNWVTLSSKSNMVARFTDKEPNNYISQFPYPFYKVNESNNPNGTIVISDEFSEGELASALILSAYLGNINAYGDYKGSLVKYSDIGDNIKNIIYIGGSKGIPNNIRMSFKELEEQDYNNNAIIKMATSPYNKPGENNKIIAILSDNDELLKKGISFLMNKDLVDQGNSDTVIINKDLKTEILSVEEGGNITFKELGNNEIKFEGPFRRSGRVGYILPRNKVLTQGAKIKIFTRYSDNLDFTKSLMTIYVNGTPIGSKKLEKDKANGDELELLIPMDVSKSTYVEVTIAFDLELEGTYCEFRQEEMPWALVTGDSYLFAPNNDTDLYMFDTYPNPFVYNRKFNQTELLIPENLSSADLTGLSLTFSSMGRDVKYTDGTLVVVKGSNFKEEDKSKNLIIYGTPSNNPFIKSINDNLWFKYDSQYKAFISNEKLPLISPYSSNIAVYQFAVSPFNKDKAMLVITSPREDVLRKSLLYLYSDKEKGKISGDSIVVDDQGNVKNFRFKKDIKKPVVTKIEKLDTKAKGLIAVIGLFIVFLITAGVLYYRKNRSE